MTTKKKSNIPSKASPRRPKGKDKTGVTGKKPVGKKAADAGKTAVESVVITMVVDESGSMMGLRDATISGFNEYVETLRKSMSNLKTYFSAITFDTRGVRKLQVGATIPNAIRLSYENYAPNGGTPLFDAIGSAVEATDRVMTQQAGTKAIVVIQTDGEENSSQKYGLAEIRAMIENRQANGWEFAFIGAGINAFSSGTRMGINAANTMSYTADAGSTREVFRATATNSALFGSGYSGTIGYTAEQSAASGEAANITNAKMAHVKKPKPAPDASSSIGDLNLGG